jgi:acyl-CoA synthetase (NDP forming)
VAVVTHSGSVFSALLHNDRGLAFNLVVSAGMELVTTAAAYLDHALELASTRVVALFLETVREPAAFRAALAKAAAREVPVVALKVGRGPAAGEMVAAHSGALAGADGAYQALFDAYGVARVHSLDELVDTCELLAAGRRAFPGGLAAIHDSGGERAHLMDLAEEQEVPLARVSAATRARLAAVLEPGLPAVNPLDAWGTGNDADEIFAACARALLDDPDTGVLALALDLTTEPTPDTSWTGLAIRTAAATDKPVVVLGNLASAVDPADAARLRAAGVPVLEGTATGLAALRHLLAHREFLAHPPAAAVAGPTTAPAAAAPAAPGASQAAAGPAGQAVAPPWVSPAARRASPGGAAPRCGRGGGSGWRTRGRSARWRHWPCWPTGGCRWWRPRRRPAWRPPWPPPGGPAGRWRSRPPLPASTTRPRWAACAWTWPARSSSPPPTPTSPAGSARGWWSRGWPKAAWSWPSGWSATRSSGRW